MAPVHFAQHPKPQKKPAQLEAKADHTVNSSMLPAALVSCGRRYLDLSDHRIGYLFAADAGGSPRIGWHDEIIQRQQISGGGRRGRDALDFWGRRDGRPEARA
jgi:hypothetical protein